MLRKTLAWFQASGIGQQGFKYLYYICTVISFLKFVSLSLASCYDSSIMHSESGTTHGSSYASDSAAQKGTPGFNWEASLQQHCKIVSEAHPRHLDETAAITSDDYTVQGLIVKLKDYLSALKTPEEPKASELCLGPD